MASGGRKAGASWLRRLADSMRAVMLAMAVVLVALAVFFTSSASADVRLNVVTFIVISAALIYVAPALFVDDVGKPHMDAVLAASIALAALSLAEAFLVIMTSWGALVMLVAPFPPLAAGFAVCLACPKRFNALAASFAVFGFLTFMAASATAFAGHRIFFMVFAFLTAIGYLGYISILLDEDLHPSSC